MNGAFKKCMTILSLAPNAPKCRNYSLKVKDVELPLFWRLIAFLQRKGVVPNAGFVWLSFQ
jgi:hypothetical protein